MSVNGVTNTKNTYIETQKTTQKKDKKEDEVSKAVSTKESQNYNEAAVVYERETAKRREQDNKTIEKMKAIADKKMESLRSLVEKMMLKQGQTLAKGEDIWNLLREGKLEIDPEIAAKAQEDISEDGYWGVEQTSERLVSFAKAISYHDPSKADELIDAVVQGFEEATKAWGGELPEICKKTLELTKEKLNQWKEESGIDGKEGNE